MNAEAITIPVWLVSLLVSVSGSGLIVWGGIAAAKTKLDRAIKDIEAAEQKIKNLQDDKVSRAEFQMVYDRLNSIEELIRKIINK
jgi:hypothetical protein